MSTCTSKYSPTKSKSLPIGAILHSYNNGRSKNSLASEYGVSTTTISGILTRNNILLRSSTISNFTSDDTKKLIVEKHTSGIPINLISENLGVSQKTARSVLKSNGIRTDKLRTDINTIDLINDYVGGIPESEIIKKYKIDRSVLYRTLKRQGVNFDRIQTIFQLYPEVNKDSLFDLYVNQNLKQSDISELLKIPQCIISRFLIEFGIPTKTHHDYKVLSKPELDLYGFVINNYGGEVIQNKKFAGYEIDIFLPELNIGIEFNGLYWHSELYKSQLYHSKKSDFFENMGIQLLHVWSDDWSTKRTIIESIILNSIGKNNRIYARKCQIKEIPVGTSRYFINANHLQGFVNYTLSYGLYHDGNLVQILTFKKCGDKWEISRSCTSLGFNVVGGFSKLFKYFLKINNAKHVFSYVSRDLFSGKSYVNNGFILNKITKPRMFWSNGNERFNRQMFQKHKLVGKGFDIDKSGPQIMSEIGYYRVFDSGNYLYGYIN